MGSGTRDGVGRRFQVIAAYESLLSRSSRMLEQARSGDWEALIDEESRYLGEVDRLSQRETEVELGVEDGKRKSLLLEQIIAQETEIRHRLTQRRDELARLIDSSRRERDVRRSYRVPDPVVIDGSDRFDKGRR